MASFPTQQQRKQNVKVPNYLFQFYIFLLEYKIGFQYNDTVFPPQLELFKQTGDLTKQGTRL